MRRTTRHVNVNKTDSFFKQKQYDGEHNVSAYHTALVCLCGKFKLGQLYLLDVKKSSSSSFRVVSSTKNVSKRKPLRSYKGVTLLITWIC
jgi:hypothetical protein